MGYNMEDERSIRKAYLMMNLPYPKWKRSQIGGAYISYKGHPIQYRTSINGNAIIFGGRNMSETSNARPCFMLDISVNAILLSIERGNDCFLDGYTDTKGIIKVAMYLARKHGATTMSLTDNSTISCPEKVKLSDLSFLTSGKTWYESAIPWLVPDDSNIRAQLPIWRNRALTNTWYDVAEALRNDNTLTEKVIFDTTGIDIHASGSAMAVLDKAKQARTHCRFFSNCMKNLLEASHVDTLHEQSWTTPLMPTSNNSSNRGTRKQKSTTNRKTMKRITRKSLTRNSRMK
jgi:hypothetical protein